MKILRLTFSGSISRAQTWRNAIDAHTYVRQQLPTKPATVEAMRALVEPMVTHMLARSYAHESHIYPGFLAVLDHTLTDRATSHDTSNNPYLSGQKPDLSLALPGAMEPQSELVIAVIEVKKPEIVKLETDQDLGQVLDYLVAMSCEQPGRRIFTGILSCIKRNTVVTLEVIETGWLIAHHLNSDIYETLAYLHDTALVELSHLPPNLGFLYNTTNLRRRLGNPRNCLVGEFPVQGTPGLVMAVKRYANPALELSYLRFFSNAKHVPASLPLLEYVAPDESEFGITPVGAPLVPGAFANQRQAQTILIDVLEALNWLHKEGIVHRDVRCSNVIITPDGHGVLIDFDAACDYHRGNVRTWQGGYICCPPHHVRQVIAQKSGWSTFYAPDPADDLGAWILLVNCLIFPTAFAGFQSHLIGTTSAESSRLLALWGALEVSKVWGPFVDAAKRHDIDTLRMLPDVFTWL